MKTTTYRPAATSAMERACLPTVCNCCGRENLKVTVKMLSPDGAVVWFGRGCAAKAMGVGIAEYSAAAKAAQSEHDDAEKRKADAKDAAMFAAATAWLTERVGDGNRFEQLRRIGGFARAVELGMPC